MRILIAAILSLTLVACATPKVPNPIDATTRSTLKYTSYSIDWSQMRLDSLSEEIPKDFKADFSASIDEQLPQKLAQLYAGNRPVDITIKVQTIYLPGLGMSWLSGASPTISTNTIVEDVSTGEVLGEYEVVGLLVNSHGLLGGAIAKSFGRAKPLAVSTVSGLMDKLSQN